jgi:hypothetical protein
VAVLNGVIYSIGGDQPGYWFGWTAAYQP